MDYVIERALLHACTEAAKALGDDIKGMSCFVSNWLPANEQDVDEVEEVREDLAA